MNRSLLATTFLLASAGARSASAQVVTWNANAQQFDTGSKPGLAVGYMNGSDWQLEVHQGQAAVGPLWYSSGNGTFGSPSSYATGTSPAVADATPWGLESAAVLEVHQSQAGFGPLFYMIGTMNSSATSVAWSAPVQYDNGVRPAIAVGNGTTVEVHQGTNGLGALWYHAGTVNGAGQVTWNANAAQYDYGAAPSVAVSLGYVVEVHQGTNGVGPLWYHVGVLSGTGVTWNANAYQYDNGAFPSVTMYGTTIIETHQGGSGSGPLWYHIGVINPGSSPPTVTWQPHAYQYDNGSLPSIAWSVLGDTGLEVHQGTAGNGPLWSHSAVLDELPVALDGQLETNWCWAASGEMIMGYLGTQVTQCAEANHAYNLTDCCTNPTDAANTSKCDQPGWPDFSYYGFNFLTYPDGDALPFSVLQSEAGSNRPVAFSWSWATGGGHMMVATGVETVGDNDQYVLVNDPEPVGSGDSYVQLYSAWVSGSGYTHWRDYYQIVKN